MKLISEFTEQNIQCLVEKKEDGEKNYVIEGVFAQADKKNRNGRVYPKPIMENAVNKYVQTQVNKKRAVGELNHPEGRQLTWTRFRTSSQTSNLREMMWSERHKFWILQWVRL